jgi:hypothetical protein
MTLSTGPPVWHYRRRGSRQQAAGSRQQAAGSRQGRPFAFCLPPTAYRLLIPVLSSLPKGNEILLNGFEEFADVRKVPPPGPGILYAMVCGAHEREWNSRESEYDVHEKECELSERE